MSFFDDYLKSEEATITKIFELKNCQYFIKEFLFLNNVMKKIYYEFDGLYYVHFSTDEVHYRDLHRRFFQ